jgi:short-subunit dehydrogenase
MQLVPLQRGIGEAIAVRCASRGANLVILAQTTAGLSNMFLSYKPSFHIIHCIQTSGIRIHSSGPKA